MIYLFVSGASSEVHCVGIIAEKALVFYNYLSKNQYEIFDF